MPHNLARHALYADDLGLPKALALACQLADLLGEPADAFVTNILDPDEDLRGRFDARLSEASVVIDASASVAVSRYLSDLTNIGARRVSTFFNPAGTAVVLLVEAEDRSVNLRDLEAQYHRLALTEPSLVGHLRPTTDQGGVRYSGSCRALTNRIPASGAALLSALAARGLAEVLGRNEACVRVWTLTEDGGAAIVTRAGAPVHRISLEGWDVTYDRDLLGHMAALREAQLPRETGGVLLGIVDVSRRSIHAAIALPEPSDSVGTVDGFERGVVGLPQSVEGAAEASLHQIRYIGEWHSHPRRYPPLPSSTDWMQVEWLGAELAREGLPALMAIASDCGTFTFVVRDGTRGRA